MALLLHVLSALFGLGSWVAINGLWVELPLLVPETPEGWYLPSYLTILIQLANVGPLLVTLLHRFRPGWLPETRVVYAIVCLGVVSCLLVALFWKETGMVGGERHSTALLALAFFLSLVDCTSSVTFLPFMSRLQARYLTSYYTGEGLSGLVPALVALAQGVGVVTCHQDNVTVIGNTNAINTDVHNITTINSVIINTNTTATMANLTDANLTLTKLVAHYQPANFSPRVFFFLLAGMMLMCLMAFGLLNHLPLARRHHQQHHRTPGKYGKHSPACPGGEADRSTKPEPVEERDPERERERVRQLENERDTETEQEPERERDTEREPEPEPEQRPMISRRPSCWYKARPSTFQAGHYTWPQATFIFLVLAWVNGLTNAVLPSVQSYSCLPYGSLAYHLSATLGAMANPLACFLAMFLPSRSLRLMLLLTVTGTTIGAYIMGMAVLSPCPWLVHTHTGTALMVLSWTLFTGSLSYVKVMIGVILREEGHSALLLCGAVVQLGSMLGALTMFPLVSVYSLFRSGDPCNSLCLP
ncbi:riboflavin transporter 2 [Callorhinchus milii]|uniref:riboflavin transporter 2 n=1 Tax=Callorhinchus milii TaxID=7868 RepID=UPI001C3FE020|nr:riboflavin transporter 2 [Callorhinchus milii]